MESMKAILAGTQVRDQDHAGKGKIIILGSNSISWVHIIALAC